MNDERRGLMGQIVSPEDRAAEKAAAARRRTAAVGEADRVLVLLHHAISGHANGSPEQSIDGDENYLLREIRKARGAIAEWRPETD